MGGPCSLRREARRKLGLGVLPSPAVEGGFFAGKVVPRQLADVAWLLVPIGMLFVPVHVTFGPLGDAMKSQTYLSAAWQVVAIAVGLSVAIMAVLFSALLAGTSRTMGVSLLDFASGSGMMTVVRLGIATLLVDGSDLFPLGQDSPGGWAGLWSLVMSAATLVAVLWVFERAVVSLDTRGLARLRIRKVQRAAQAALRTQLVRQAGEQYLQEQGSHLGIARALSTQTADVKVTASRDGEVHDVNLRRLRRLIVFEAANSRVVNVRLLGLEVLGQPVQRGNELMALASGTPDRVARRARRAVRIGRQRQRRDVALQEELDGVHRQALTAIREGDRVVWDLIADCYEEALLELPRAAALYGLPFAGAVAAPGPFQLGPLQQVQRYLYEEIEAAVRTGDRSLAYDVAYLPMRVAQRAASLNAPSLVRSLLALYPSLYLLAQEAPS